MMFEVIKTALISHPKKNIPQMMLEEIQEKVIIICKILQKSKEQGEKTGTSN